MMPAIAEQQLKIMSAANGVFSNKKESQLEKEGLLHQKRLLKLEMENEKLKLLALT